MLFLSIQEHSFNFVISSFLYSLFIFDIRHSCVPFCNRQCNAILTTFHKITQTNIFSAPHHIILTFFWKQEHQQHIIPRKRLSVKSADTCFAIFRYGATQYISALFADEKHFHVLKGCEALLQQALFFFPFRLFFSSFFFSSSVFLTSFLLPLHHLEPFYRDTF